MSTGATPTAAGISGEIPFPRYHQVQLTLRQRILDDVYESLIPMPGERELAAEFAVGRVTVRAALAALEKQGLVARRQGKDTFPQAASRKGGQELQGGVLENLVSMGLRTKVTVLALVKCPASEAVAHQLRLKAGDAVVKVIRVRSFKGVPIVFTEAYVPADLGSNLTRKALLTKPMLVLLEDAGLRVHRAEQTLTARAADTVMVRALEVPLGIALLSVQRVATERSGRPVQYLIGHYRPDRYEYRMTLSRSGEETRIWVDSSLDSDGSPHDEVVQQ